jgi:hypothetical protein
MCYISIFLCNVFRTELYENVSLGLDMEGRDMRMRDGTTITDVICCIRGSHNNDYEKHDLPGCNEVYWLFGGTYRLDLQGWRVS